MNSGFSFIITTLAGLSTMLGTILIFKKKNDNIIISSLSFASGIMFSVSLVELIPESLNLLNRNVFISFIFILLGMILSMIIDKYINIENKLYQVGILSMIVIIFHNIPEGIITFISASTNASLGIVLAIAIALHNIPEGISISLPIYYATNSKFKAFFYTFISALSEPLGAILAYVFLSKFITNNLLGILFSLIAGIMTYISIFELLPTSLNYKKKNLSYLFFIIGFLFMFINHFIF